MYGILQSVQSLAWVTAFVTSVVTQPEHYISLHTVSPYVVFPPPLPRSDIMVGNYNAALYRINQHKCALNAAAAELRLAQGPHADFPFGPDGVGALLDQKVMPYAKYQPFVDVDDWYEAMNKGSYAEFYIDPPLYCPVIIKCGVCSCTCNDLKYPVEVCSDFQRFDDISVDDPPLRHVCIDCISTMTATQFQTYASQHFQTNAANLRMRRKQFQIPSLKTYAKFERTFAADTAKRDWVRAAKEKAKKAAEKAEKAEANSKKRKAPAAAPSFKSSKKAKTSAETAARVRAEAARKKAEEQAAEARRQAEAARKQAERDAADAEAAEEQRKRDMREAELERGKRVILASWRMTQAASNASVGLRISAQNALEKLIKKYQSMLTFDKETGKFTVL